MPDPRDRTDDDRLDLLFRASRAAYLSAADAAFDLAAGLADVRARAARRAEPGADRAAALGQVDRLASLLGLLPATAPGELAAAVGRAREELFALRHALTSRQAPLSLDGFRASLGQAEQAAARLGPVGLDAVLSGRIPDLGGVRVDIHAEVTRLAELLGGGAAGPRRRPARRAAGEPWARRER
jgi:hypothetical protein